MKHNSSLLLFITISVILFSSCSGIKYLTVETREPAQVTLPSDVLSVTIVNNVITQPNDIGHTTKRVGHSSEDKIKASADSISIIYMEALAQFLEEEDYFQKVHFIPASLRKDKDFFADNPITPESMMKLMEDTGADAIISLDKLLLQTNFREFYKQQGYSYGNLTSHIESLIRVYLPTLEGKIPAVFYNDSLKWEGFDIQDENAYSTLMIPSREEAMKLIVIHAAEKMTNVLAPHWEMQDRWYYTLPASLMREGETYAKGAEWHQALNKWESFYNRSSKKVEKAKAANNIALAYEMLDDMSKSYEWATKANELFIESTSLNSLERRRSLLYKNEILRRMNTHNRINMNEM